MHNVPAAALPDPNLGVRCALLRPFLAAVRRIIDRHVDLTKASESDCRLKCNRPLHKSMPKAARRTVGSGRPASALNATCCYLVRTTKKSGSGRDPRGTRCILIDTRYFSE